MHACMHAISFLLLLLSRPVPAIAVVAVSSAVTHTVVTVIRLRLLLLLLLLAEAAAEYPCVSFLNAYVYMSHTHVPSLSGPACLDALGIYIYIYSSSSLLARSVLLLHIYYWW
eukprot:GHVU01221775.1.p1 GENE.GHVU01221775.1~~GHVU01221775.1.p1  ORF type:complete len:113 (+),score=11.93 GHVU01221775.1:541-879(+)